MLVHLHRAGRFFVSRGWVAGLVLIVLTIGLGTVGFLSEKFDSGKDHTLLDAIYKAASLLAIQTGSIPTSGNLVLEIARWLGMFFFASALLTFAIRLFRESVQRVLVMVLARDHVILAGLGHHGSNLVQALRRRGLTVVVVEPDRDHPALENCRDCGAIVLTGEPTDPGTLRIAGLDRAFALLALFSEERESLRIVTTAFSMLRGQKKTIKRPVVRCVLRLTEPGLLDVIRKHRIKTDPADRIQLEVLNAHEIAATTMVREAEALRRPDAVRKVMVLGLGTHHRLGEMVVLRFAKDHMIKNNGEVTQRLDIHIFDDDAEAWVKSVRGRHAFLDRACQLEAHPCWARKVGAGEFDTDFDAAFICIADEGHATAQAVMLRREVLRAGQPIMVRVVHSQTGFGGLLQEEGSGWGENIHAVGLEDALFDPDTATKPELELRARTIHQDYRGQQKDLNQPANRPWERLAETFRESNRELAKRYAAHLASTDGKLKKERYRWEFRPDAFTATRPGETFLFTFTPDEVEFLAAREHTLWKEERERAGWTYGPVRDVEKKTNPLLVDYSKLTDDSDREYNRTFVRRVPYVLALADYTIVKDETKKSSADNG